MGDERDRTGRGTHGRERGLEVAPRGQGGSGGGGSPRGARPTSEPGSGAHQWARAAHRKPRPKARGAGHVSQRTRGRGGRQGRTDRVARGRLGSQDRGSVARDR